MTDIAELALKIDALDVKLANAELDKLSRTSGNTEQSVNRLTSSINSGFSTAKASIAGLVAGFASFESIKSVANAALDIQKINNALEVGVGSADAAGKAMRFLRDASRELGLDLRESALQFSRLAAAAKGTALEGQATQDAFLGVSKAAVALGLSSEEAGGALLAIQQIISKGKVSLEELSGQLGERLPGALQIAARAMGMTVEELNKLVSTGNLAAEQLLPRLSTELEKTFGNQAQSAASGLQSQINRFNTALFEMKIAIGNTGLIEFLTSGIQLATKLTNSISNLFGSAEQLSAIDKQRQMIAGLREELASLNDRKNVPLVGELLFDKRSADILKQRIEDGEADLQRLIDKAEKLKTIPTAKPDQTRDKALEASKKVTKEVVSESEKFLAALKKEARQAGLSANEIRRLEAAKLGISDSAEPFIQRIEQEESAFRNAEEAANSYRDQLARAASITESVMTAEERFAQTQAELNQLLNSGALGTEHYNRALKQAEEQLFGVSRSGKRAFDELDQFAVQAARNVQTAFADFFFDPFDKGIKGMINNFATAIRRLIAETLALKTSQALGFGGLLGFGGTASASGGSGGMGMMDIASMGSNLLSLGSSAFSTGLGATGLLGNVVSGAGSFFGSGSMAAFGAGMADDLVMGVAAGVEAGMSGAAAASATTMGASFASVAGPMIALAAVDVIGRVLAGNKSTGTFADMLPVVGGFAGALFGHGPMKQKETNLIGEATASGFEGFTRTKFKAQGGLFVGDKVKRIDNDLTLEFETLLDSAITGFSSSLKNIAGDLGLGTEAIDNFSKAINIATEKGKGFSDEQIAELLAEIGNEMATSLLPGVENFRRAGETALTTLQRLGSEFNVLVGLGAALGNSLSDTETFLRSISFDQRSAFVDAAGGLDALAAKAQFFSDNFLSDSEKLEPAIEQLNREMSELGLSAEMSKSQFRDLVQSFGQTDGITQEMLQELLNVAPLFIRVKNGLAELHPELQAVADATFDLAAAEKLIADKRSALIAAYSREKSSLESVITRFSDLAANLRTSSASLSLSNLSPLTPEQRLEEARRQFNLDRSAAGAGDEEALRRLPESGRAFLEASQIFNASSAEFISDFNFVKGVLESSARVADTEAEIAKSQLSQLELTVNNLIEIDKGVGSVEDAIRELTAAVLQGQGNPAISDQAIRDFINTPGRSTQEIMDAAVKFNVSGSQIAKALSVDQSVINKAAGGVSVSDQAIKQFVDANINNPRAIYDAAIANGISSKRLSEVTGISLEDINNFVRMNNLPAFESGTDFVGKGGLAVLHPAEAVTPASHMKEMANEIKALRQELSELRREQNQQTGALINVAVESQRMNANMIIKSNQESEKSAAWRDQAKVAIR